MTDMFAQDPGVNQDTDYLNELVGEGKKFKTPAELARGKAEADRHIENLNRTLEELRNELKTKTTEEDLMNRITSLSNRQPEQRQEPPQTDSNQAKGLTKEDVDRMFSEREQVSRQTHNLNEVQSRLAEMYGTNAANEIDNKSRELGISKEDLRSMAGSQPKVFLALFQPKAQVQDMFNAPAQGRNTQLEPQNQGVKKFSDYQKLRRENPNEYFGAKVQRELIAIGDKLGGPGSTAYDKWRNS